VLTFDFRDAFRSLIRDPLYLAVSIATLALTIGATATVFSIVNGVLLKPLPYDQPDALVAVNEIWRQFTDRFPTVPVNERHFEYWRAHATNFESLAMYLSLPANLTGIGDATEITVVHATGSLFDALRTRAALGRTLAASDERPGEPDVVVLADRLWTEKFNRDPSVVGRTIVLDGKPYAVVGVMRPAFRLPRHGQLTAKVDAFVPVRVDEDHVGWIGEHNFTAIGRLRRGTTSRQANAELDGLQDQIALLASKEAQEPVTLAADVTGLADTVVGTARRGLLLLLAAIVAVLLIACSNLANLSLTRTLARMRETAIRSALGAGRARLLRRLVIEHLGLATIGGAAGLLLARSAIVAFVRTAPIDLPRTTEVTLDARVIVCTVLVIVVAGLLVAAIPAWQLSTADVHDQLRGGLTATDTPARLRTRGLLLLLQIAIAVTLLVVTSLLTLSLVRVLRSDLGFQPERTLAVDVVLPLNRYAKPAQRAQVADRLLDEMRAVPGVTAAAWAHMLPLEGQATVNVIAAEGDPRPFTQQPPANYRYVSADYFKTLSIPFRRGGTFGDTDLDQATTPAVVSERTATRIWPNSDPIGRRFRWMRDPSEKPAEVVGVVADTKTDIDGESPLLVYMPYWYRPRSSTSLVVHTAGDPIAAAGAVRHVLHRVDPEIAIASVRPMEQMVDNALASRRYQTRLFLAFGAMALALAMVGVYGVTSYGVSRRRREMNIRQALGASTLQVFGLVLRQTMAPLAGGIVLGIAAAFATSTIVAGLLYGVSARDLRVISAVAAFVGAVGIGSAVAAARQGLALDPASALRDE
jgi:predicted permease